MKRLSVEFSTDLYRHTKTELSSRVLFPSLPSVRGMDGLLCCM